MYEDAWHKDDSYDAAFFFSETEAKDLPHRLIKQKRVAQLINGKPGENRYKPTTCGLLTGHATR
jgi:hypothetical protein